MNILLTNDDGIYCAGLQLLCSQLAALKHNVYVVAPESQRSGFSHAVFFGKNSQLTPLKHYCGAQAAYACNGTPADCVRAAKLTFDVSFDLLIAGPNNGANLGRGIIYSGTIGAAEEGVLSGIRSIALSRLGRNKPYFSAVEFAVNNLDKLAAANLGDDSYININVPDCKLSQTLGVKVCDQGICGDCGLRANDRDVPIVCDKRCPDSDLPDEMSQCDVACAKEDYITVSALTVRRTATDRLAALRGLLK